MLQPLSEYLFTGRFALAVRLGGICYVYYINSCPSVQARRAFCCAFPAFLLPMAREQTARRGCARSGALGLPGAGHGLAACLGVSTRSLSGVLCVVYSSATILWNSHMGYAPAMLISLSWNTRKLRYPGPACSCHALPKCSLIGVSEWTFPEVRISRWSYKESELTISN